MTDKHVPITTGEREAYAALADDYSRPMPTLAQFVMARRANMAANMAWLVKEERKAEHARTMAANDKFRYHPSAGSTLW